MAGRGMGAATKGGGCVGSGSRNKMTSKPSTKVAVMMKDGGDVKSKDKEKDYKNYKGSPMGQGIGMALEAVGIKKKKSPRKELSQATPKKKMGGGMMQKYKKGGYAGCK